MDEQMIRAWWAQRQGLDGSLVGASAADVLERAGWQRSLGGVGTYLSFFARAGLSRAAVEAAVAGQAIQELPSTRGCMYAVPASHFAVALRLGQGKGEFSEISLAKKHFGVTDAELDRLCAQTLDALSGQSLEPRVLKEAVRGAVRDFGPEGVKRGVTSTLPLALGKLEALGEIRRVPRDGRLDEKRYSYTCWRDNPLAKASITLEEAQTALARHYFRWIGPARLAHFQWFSGLSAKAATAAIAPLGLVPLAADDDRLLHPDDRDALHAFKAPTQPQPVLTSTFDNLIHLHRDIPELLASDAHLQQLYGAQGTQRMGGLADLQSHPIVDRGYLIGLWDYDDDTNAIVWATFDAPPPNLPQAVAGMERFITSDLRSSRANSLDDLKTRQARIAALRKMNGG